MMSKKLQTETRAKIVEARKKGSRKDENELWNELYGDKVPSQADFGDCFRAVEHEEKQAAEQAEADKNERVNSAAKSTAKPKSTPVKKSGKKIA